MRPQGIPEDYIKMKAFPFSLDRVVKDWLYLQPVLFNTWGDKKLSVVKCRLDLSDTKADSLLAIRSWLTRNRYGFSQK
ncbi:hypothetical protein CR513_13675, partial [Mucuna pruriens]